MPCPGGWGGHTQTPAHLQVGYVDGGGERAAADAVAARARQAAVAAVAEHAEERAAPATTTNLHHCCLVALPNSIVLGFFKVKTFSGTLGILRWERAIELAPLLP